MRTRNFLRVKVAGAYCWQPYHLHVPTACKCGGLDLLEPLGMYRVVVPVVSYIAKHLLEFYKYFWRSHYQNRNTVHCRCCYLPLIRSDWQYSRSYSQTSPSQASRILLQNLKLVWAHNESNHSALSSVEVKNEWRLTSTPSLAFMLYTAINLL